MNPTRIGDPMAEQPTETETESSPEEVLAFIELLLKLHPEDEMLRFARSLALCKTGDQAAADLAFAEGIAHLDQLWMPKLRWFAGASLLLVVILLLLGIVIPLVLIPAALLGPLVWYWVLRNRRRYVPPIGFSLMDNIANRTDLREAKIQLEKQFADRNKKERISSPKSSATGDAPTSAQHNSMDAGGKSEASTETEILTRSEAEPCPDRTDPRT